VELAIIIIALLVLGSLVAREHTLTQEIVTLKRDSGSIYRTRKKT
jgi:hypothetical protein